jgi:Ca2+-binding EF-hand superfamily protein
MDTNKDGTIDYDEFIRATEPDIDQLNRYLKFDIDLVEGQRKAGVV